MRPSGYLPALNLSTEGEQEKQHGVLFFASDKLENLLLRYRASEGTVTTVLPASKGNAGPRRTLRLACVLGTNNEGPVAQTAPQQGKEKDTAMG